MGRGRSWLGIVLVLLAAGCGLNSVKGSGALISETRTISGVTSVELGGTGKLTIDQNGTESLTITADDNLMPYLRSDVSGGRLTLGVKGVRSVSPSRDIIYELTVKDLNGISIAGSASVDAKGLSTDVLKIEAAGSTSVTVAGKADRQEIEIAGSGDYRGGDLQSRTTKISIAGSASALLAVSEKLDADIAGAGSIKYIGDPMVTQHVLGSGSIQKQ